ncbi:unnamed protein product [Paramecium octaurelia]|uniref:EF-hand domain-containing protein n=1 Tax=Paramecium octaurelia TaxID=43137 RepID=A0A8S1XGS6_PAROT|nr:unnamed protein product [Paramecium octaurelia]
MGNQIMGKFRKNRFQGFSDNQIDYLSDKWLQIESNGVIDPNKFADQYNVTHKEAIKIIKLMDFDDSGRVDYYKFKVGVASLCQNPMTTTAKSIFDLYDEDRDNKLGPKEVGIFLTSIFNNLHYYEGLEDPTPKELEEKLQQYLVKWDLDRDGGFEYEEYLKLMQKDPDVLKVLFNMGLANKDEMTIEETCYNDIDSDIEIEMERRLLPRDERVERIKNGIEHTISAEASDEFGLEEEEVVMEWKEQAKKLEPSKKPEGMDASPPNAILDLEYVYGYRCHDTRNNLKYGNKGQIVYHTAGVGIVLDPSNMTQKHFLEHNDDISCLDIYENLVLTGQVGLNPMLMVWNIDNMRMVCLFNDVLKNGISNCCFSNDGKSVAAIAMDDDHFMAVYDIEIAINLRKDPKNQASPLIASGKLTKQEIFDIKFLPGDWQIVVACMKEISICTWKNGTILAERGVWKEQQPQPVLTIAINGGYIVTGVFNGNFLCWKKNICVKSVKAHVTPVKAIMTRSAGRGIISADKRGIIMGWDPQFNKVFEIDTKDLPLKLSYPPKGSPNVISVCESPEGKILFGTRRSEIAEILSYEEGQKIQCKLLMQGHFNGELWGLDTHPTQNIFYTVGEDEMLGMWDVKQKKLLKQTPNQYASKTLSVSQNGKWVATGCANGRVFIYDASSLKKISEITEVVDPDKEIVSLVKFSPNNEILCVCYKPPFSEIAFYSTKTWKKQSKIPNCKYHVYTLDFSADSKFIQLNTSNYTIEFYDVSSGQPVPFEAAKDIQWFTWTCIYGWQVQGIWPDCSDGDDVNATDRSKDGKCLVSCDDFGKIKLFKYPCPKEKSGCIKYTGHSSYVCGVKFTNSGEHIISVGGDELSIFQWRYIFSPSRLDVQDIQEEPEKVEENVGGAMFEQEELDKGDMIGAVKPFLGEVQHSVPSWYKPNKARDNQEPKGNLSLYHIHGFRFFYILDECRDMLGWTDKNKVVFVSAALGVEVDPKTQQQAFFNKHEEDIVSFALHPNRNIAATGQMAQAGKAKCIDIFVWDIDSKEVLANFNQFHLRAIVLLKFSPDGSLLLTVGQDDDNSLAIYDWQGKRQICTSNIDKAKVNGAAWKDNEEFVTVGNKHIKFWKISGRNVQGKMGQQQGKFESQFSVAYAFDNQVIVSGGGSGTLFCWKGGSSDKGIKGHEGKVCSFIMDKAKKLLYSGGLDGKVISWGYEGGQLVKKQEIINLATNPLFPPGVVAMDYNEKTQQWLFGTNGAQIFSYDPAKKQTSIVVQGHFGEELWGACAAPTGHKYVTGGGDKTVRVWDIDQKKMVCVSKPFPSEVRAVDWSTDGKFIVCGDLNGFVYLLDPNTLQIMDTAKTIFTTMPKRQSTYWIDDLKISPDCKKVAFGAHGGASHLEVWTIEYPKFGKQGTKIQCGLTSALTALDWSVDSSIVIVNSGAYELKYVDVNAKKNQPSSSQANTEFASWTCKLGWPVQGIFPSADYSDVNTVCRSNSKKYLVSGEDTQHVVLMNYPVVVPKQKRKEYIGHSSHVMRVRFTCDDNFLISVGGNDKSIIVWKTDFGSAQGKVEQVNLQEFCKEEGADDIDMPVKKKKAQPPPKKQIQQDENSVFSQEETDEGDQFMACKPWMGAIKEPTYQYYSSKTDGHKPPKCDLEIEYVHGYRTKDMRNNLFFLANGQVLYNAAALGIVLDVGSNTQTYFNKHEDDITAIDLNPVDRMTVATGELGAKPNIFVWNAETKEVKCQFKAPLQKGIIAMAFTPNGKRLVAGAVDVDHSLAVFDVSGKGAVLWSDKSGPDVIVDLRWNTDDAFVTVGVKHYKCWKYDNGKCQGKKGQFGKGASNNLSGIAINGNDTLCGAADGCIQVWKGEAFMKPLPSKHAQICDCITVTQDYVFSGGRDGVFFVLSKNYEEILAVKVKEKCPDSVCPSVRAIYADLPNSKLLIGTLGSEIYQFSWDGGAINSQTDFQVTNLMRGHFCPNLKWTNEVWGLDIFQEDQDKFVTCSDDGTVRVWSIADRKQVKIGSTLLTADGKEEKRDLNTGDFTDQCKARVVSTNPKDEGFTAGMKDGTIRIYDAEFNQTKVFKQAKEWISDIKFSPDGTTCVIGSHDNALYAYKYPSWKAIGKKMQKHSSYITHFDFSRDGVNLHSTCGAYELLFWDVAQCKQLPGGASALKDELWYTWTVTLGWPVQGIWPECADGTDINAVDRSNTTINGKNDPKTSYHLLASGDDFSHVRILRFPSLKKSSEAVVGTGHSSHVTNVKWTKDDSRIISTGGEDQCVFVWKVTKK